MPTKQNTMAKQAPKEKKSPIVKVTKKLILNKTIHISGVKVGKDGVSHMVSQGHYKPGTEVTEEMMAAWERNRIAVGGETGIEAFCE